MDALNHSGQILLLEGFNERVMFRDRLGVLVFIYDNTVKFKSRGRFLERFVHNLVYNREILIEMLWGIQQRVQNDQASQFLVALGSLSLNLGG